MKSIMSEVVKMAIVLFSMFYTCLDLLQNLKGLDFGGFDSLVRMSLFYSLVMTIVLFMVKKVKSRRDKIA